MELQPEHPNNTTTNSVNEFQRNSAQDYIVPSESQSEKVIVCHVHTTPNTSR